MRYLNLFALLLPLAPAMAQTGPGGVGTSTSNVLWLDGNYGVTHASGVVSAWADRSGNSNNALLPTTIPTAQPTLVTASVNGYPSLDFDGTDDQLWVTDHASIDLTAWHFFVVLTADVQKNYNAWLVKGDDSDENYEMLSYSDGNIHTPTKYSDNTRTFPSSAGGQVVTGTFDIIEYSYNTTSGRDVYKNAAGIITDNESKTPKVNNLPLYIANERSTSGRSVNGDIAEVIAFNARLNSTQRIIVNNYLAAKYGRGLSVNDLYVHDNTGNGDYDHDVAGIGRVSSSNLQTDARGSGIVQIDKAGYSGLGDDEFLFWGHDNGALGTFGVTDLPTGVLGRWERVWKVNEVNTSGGAVNVGNVDITFDLAGLGPVTASDLRLLVDADLDGTFADETPISGATLVSGSLYRFSNTNALVNNAAFTLGTINPENTPLPIELVSFTAMAVDRTTVRLDWSTASESDNDHFTVERSSVEDVWSTVATIEAVGNSSTLAEYTTEDRGVPSGTYFYRLRQTDVDGTSTTSHVVAVELSNELANGPLVFPNPGNGPFTVQFESVPAQPVQLTLFDQVGRVVAMRREEPSNLIVFDPMGIAPGSYLLQVLSAGAGTMHPLEVIH
ncbi:MAG: T9SS type A sorting domain-containing protein [Flavobacteriales bacterium]|nr:T9SS type A sorting domain-containing protein [Flavobacteriales bacterium]